MSGLKQKDLAAAMEADVKIEFDRELDGRWIAEVIDLPGCLAYGATQEEARGKVQILARAIDEERAS